MDLLISHLEEKDNVLTSHTLISQNLVHLCLYQLTMGERNIFEDRDISASFEEMDEQMQ